MLCSEEDVVGEEEEESHCVYCSFARVAHRHPCNLALLRASSPYLQRNVRSLDKREELSNKEEEEEEEEEEDDDDDDEEGDIGKHEEEECSVVISRPNRAIRRDVQVYPGDECFTYSDLLTLVNRLAARVRKALPHHPHHQEGTMSPSSSTIRSESNTELARNVGIFIGPSVEYVVAVLAILQCGFAFVPLDPFWPPRRLADVIIDSETCLILAREQPVEISSNSYECTVTIRFSHVDLACEQPLKIASTSSEGSVEVPFLRVDLSCEQPPELSSTSVEDTVKPPFPHIERKSVLGIKSSTIDMGDANCTQSRRIDNEVCPCFCHCVPSWTRTHCYIMYTSGTTTKPKGVCGTEVGLMHRLCWMQREYPFGPKDVAIFKTSIAFIDHLTELFGPLLGCSLIIVPPPEDIFKNPLGLLHFLEAYKVSRLTTVPSWMRAVLPVLQSQISNNRERHSLRIVLLSGEVLMHWLLERMRSILPDTVILNLYGSTEVSGDCFFFECGALESDWAYPSVPIGKPIPGCFFEISSNENNQNEGELWVGGILVASGYYKDSYKTKENFMECVDGSEYKNMHFFKTGDYVKKLTSGILLYLGRKDRTVKMNGHKIVLEEIENTLQMHPLVAQAAVTFEERINLDCNMIAHIVIESNKEANISSKRKNSEVIKSELSQVEANLRSWMGERLPLAAIPHCFQFRGSLPLLVSGKVDYQALQNSIITLNTPLAESPNIEDMNPISTHIKHVFERVLKIDNISVHDNFFSLGGTSVSAAHVAYILGIDMQVLYHYSSALALECVLKAQKEDSLFSAPVNPGKHKRLKMVFSPSIPPMQITDHLNSSNVDVNIDLGHSWPSIQVTEPLVLLRCNVHATSHKTVMKSRVRKVPLHSAPCSLARTLSSLTIVWTVQLNACIDASPLLLVSKHKCHLFIGSHAHNFVCIDACSGSLIWESVLGGRVESSAGITLDLTQVMVGCYDGFLYFFDCENGMLRWKFQTNAEVKCQPTMDILKGLIWCGSHDHKVYILDAVNQSRVWEHDCKESIFAAPVHDSTRRLSYIATTGGSVIALTSELNSPHICWTYQSGAPIFGSPIIDTDLGYVICTSVNGFVVALTPTGLLAWQYKTLGPIFAGACISSALPSQVLVCCRDGWVYSLNVSSGTCLWKHHVGEPITSAAFVDEGLDLTLTEHNGCVVHSFRLVVVCGSLGQLHVLKVYGGLRTHSTEEHKAAEKANFQKIVVPSTEINVDMKFKACEHVAALRLPGDVFSSPVMLDGRIFIGCRDNNLYCLQIPELGI